MYITKWKNQPEKNTYCVILTIWHSEKDKTTETIKRLVVAEGYGSEKWIERTKQIIRVMKLICMILSRSYMLL